MTIETVEMYKTNDGVAHETYEKAVAHIIDKIGEELDAVLLHDKKCCELMGRREFYRVILALVGDEEKFTKLAKLLERWV